MCASCQCQGPTDSAIQKPLQQANGETRTFKVEGMTCGHCKSAVTDEVRQVSGVASVEVDVASGSVTISGDASDANIEAAVAEAGYKVTS